MSRIAKDAVGSGGAPRAGVEGALARSPGSGRKSSRVIEKERMQRELATLPFAVGA